MLKRIIGRLSCAAAATIVVSAIAIPANAEAASGIVSKNVYRNGHYFGTVEWSADPNGSNPGDALRVCDYNADGAGLSAQLNQADKHSVDTFGHSSPYCSGWGTGNLPEGASVIASVFTGNSEISIWAGDFTFTA
ncbi:hypothetical protein [Streptomyces sp. NPDC088254]|uniref:hypothetical protein n=1 Tax=Streptomyces sp. NPDC088254 TaxID=3365847 RepID=UPI003827842E